MIGSIVLHVQASASSMEIGVHAPWLKRCARRLVSVLATMYTYSRPELPWSRLDRLSKLPSESQKKNWHKTSI